MCFGQLILAGLEAIHFPASAAGQKLFRVLVSTLTMQGAMIGLIAYFLRQEKVSWREAFGFHLNPAKALAFGVLAGILVVPTAWALQQFSVWILNFFSMETQPQEIVRTFQESIKAPSSTEIFRQQFFFGISVMFIAPVAEELFFRGILYTTLKKYASPRVALWISVLLFATLHFNPPGFISFVVLALLLTFLYESTGNLFAAIATHCFFNSVNFLYMLNEQSVNRFLHRFL
jgi:membrane protease YdiL (CAAX protease family)